jgi:hypothetical protein
MNTLFIILAYGMPASLLLSAVILAMGLINPRLLLRSYPRDVQAAVPPMTGREKRQTLYWAVPFWLMVVGLSTAAGPVVLPRKDERVFPSKVSVSLKGERAGNIWRDSSTV